MDDIKVDFMLCYAVDGIEQEKKMYDRPKVSIARIRPFTAPCRFCFGACNHSYPMKSEKNWDVLEKDN